MPQAVMAEVQSSAIAAYFDVQTIGPLVHK